MKRSGPGFLLVIGLLVGLLASPSLAPAPARAGHPAYERLLAQGTVQLQQGRPADAVRTLEVAAFGLLDDPPRRAEALTRLGLAQAAQEDAEGFVATIGRLDQVASRFDAWRAARLSAEERQAFRAQAERFLSEEARADLPWLTSAPTTSAAAPGPAEDAGEAPPPAPAPPLRPLTDDERSAVQRARSILGRAERARELDQALELVRKVADAHPRRRELQHLAAEIAYRSSRWHDAVTYFERGGWPGEEAPELSFYLAVALYETGRREEARRHLAAVLPLLERTEFVEQYRRKILGEESEP